MLDKSHKKRTNVEGKCETRSVKRSNVTAMLALETCTKNRNRYAELKRATREKVTRQMRIHYEWDASLCQFSCVRVAVRYV